MERRGSSSPTSALEAGVWRTSRPQRRRSGPTHLPLEATQLETPTGVNTYMKVWPTSCERRRRRRCWRLGARRTRRSTWLHLSPASPFMPMDMGAGWRSGSRARRFCLGCAVFKHGVRRLPRPRLCADGVGTMQESTTTRLGLEPRILETATACCATATAQQAVAFFVLA